MIPKRKKEIKSVRVTSESAVERHKGSGDGKVIKVMQPKSDSQSVFSSPQMSDLDYFPSANISSGSISAEVTTRSVGTTFSANDIGEFKSF